MENLITTLTSPTGSHFGLLYRQADQVAVINVILQPPVEPTEPHERLDLMLGEKHYRTPAVMLGQLGALDGIKLMLLYLITMPE